jgi:hypothetical protein
VYFEPRHAVEGTLDVFNRETGGNSNVNLEQLTSDPQVTSRIEHQSAIRLRSRSEINHCVVKKDKHKQPYQRHPREH